MTGFNNIGNNGKIKLDRKNIWIWVSRGNNYLL